MPAKSKAQMKFMQMVAAGKLKKKGLGKDKAKEFVKGVDVKDLPEKKKEVKRAAFRLFEKK